MNTLRTLLPGWFDGWFSKRLVPLICLSLPLLSNGQPLRLLSSDPLDGAIGVPLQTTVTFTFDAAIDTSRILPTKSAPRFAVFPQMGVRISPQRYSSDFRSMIFDVTHSPDIDVTWAFLSLHGADGSAQQRVELVRYTTAGTRSNTTLSGRLTSDLPDADFDRAIVMLLTDVEWLNQDGGPDQAFVTAGVVSPGGDLYTIPYVRPGTYYLGSFLFQGDGPIALGVRRGMDNQPVAITVDAQSLTGLDIHLQVMEGGGGDPVDAHVAWNLVHAAVTADRPDALPVDIHGSPSHMPPDGRSEEWSVIYFTTSDSLVHFTRTRGDRIVERSTIPFFDIPPEERPDVMPIDIRGIPLNAIGSQQAFAIAMANGLNVQLHHSPGQFEPQGRFEFMLSEFPEYFAPLTTNETPPFWVVRYEEWQPDSLRTWNYLMDAVTGGFIGLAYHSEANGPTGPFELVNTSPQDMSANLPPDFMVQFTFTEPVNPGFLRIGRDITVVPNLQIGSTSLSGDQRTLLIIVRNAPGTDYTWALPGVRAANGSMPQDMPILRYTTRADVSNLTITGGLTWPNQSGAMSTDGVMRTVIALFDSPDYLRNGANGEPSDIRQIGTLQPGGGQWVIRNVRPGTYYPGVFQMVYHPDGNTDLVAYGFLDNGDGLPAPITVTDASVNGVPLTLRSPQPRPERIGSNEVYDRARAVVRGSNAQAKFVLAWAREDLDPMISPNGTSYEWMFIFYDEATEMVDQLYADSRDIIEHLRFPLTDIPEEDRLDPGFITFLPDAFIRSQDAFSAALGNGLHELILGMPNNAWGQIDYQLSGIYGRYPDHLTAASNPYWEVKFNMEVRNPFGDLMRETEAYFVIDAITGAFVTKTVTTGIDSEGERPDRLELLPNTPNPFNPSTVIRYRIADSGITQLTVYDVLGRVVAVLVDGVWPAGDHRTQFDAPHLPSGLYMVVLESAGQRRHRSMMLVK